MASGEVGYRYTMKVTKTGLGRALRKIRKSAGLSQIALGETIGLTSAGMSKIESGTRDPSLRVLTAWLDACHCELHLVPGGSAEIDSVDADRLQSVDVSHLDAEARSSVATMARLIGEVEPLQRAMLVAPLQVLNDAPRLSVPDSADTIVKSGTDTPG